jgi:DNA-binding NarL/FixJ family response regulator
MGSARSIRVLVCHEQPRTRAALRAILEWESGIEVVGEASTSREAVAVSRRVRPTVVIIAIAQPCPDVIQTIRRLAAPSTEQPRRIVVLVSVDNDQAIEAVRAGAKGMLREHCPAGELVRATRAVADGEGFITPSIAGWLLEEVTRRLVPRRARAPMPCGASRLVSLRSSAASRGASRLRRSQRRCRWVRRRSAHTCIIC